ncbi:NUDIX hydrolase [Kineosporia succinea]|uniref:8-oxo-dGTP pyrophosphatase MutT (NUDIX family) n=1 Tax=Kineosporia succinea TaxID=84632 RepID=A0ABT9P056_9ACTN|nr:CoA pyrophosphatase [Kineosporia succinea]MDP9826062.1 8-oxo-dGTP pyrophosphatase MutT (NUDIX family) [Kineosporia succinea]
MSPRTDAAGPAGPAPVAAGPCPPWLDRLAAAVADPRHNRAFEGMIEPGADARHSAVLALFGEGPQGPDVLLTQRAATLRAHAGQVAFPGGRIDPGDAGPAAAALREAHEEAGVDPAGVLVRAECAELFLHVTNFRVTPVIGWWHTPSALVPGDPAEVERVVRVPLAELADPANRFVVSLRDRRSGPGFEASGLFVWGFTAGVLSWMLNLAGLEQPWDTTRVLPVPEQQMHRPARQELRRDLSEQQGLDVQDVSGPDEVDVS